jgi:hypothetical protein
MPTGIPLALWRLPQWNYIGRNRSKSFTGHLYSILDASKYGHLFLKRIAGLQTKDQACAALRAGMLRQQKDARLTTLRSSTVAEPCREWNARDMFRCDAAHVQDNCTEAAALQK